MINAVFFIPTGEIAQTATLLNAAESDATAGMGWEWVAGVADMRTDYVDLTDPATPTVTPRPALPEMVEGPTGTWTATGCPDGMTVAVWDRELDALIDTVPAVAGSISITLADPGPYRLDSAVWPYLPRSIEVDVV